MKTTGLRTVMEAGLYKATKPYDSDLGNSSIVYVFSPSRHSGSKSATPVGFINSIQINICVLRACQGGHHLPPGRPSVSDHQASAPPVNLAVKFEQVSKIGAYPLSMLDEACTANFWGE